MDQAAIQQLEQRLRAALRGQFDVGDCLGAGGFGAVFRARDPVLGRDVAIKVFEAPAALSADASDELLDEARLVARIEHPHIVPLYEAGVRDGLVYLVMRCFTHGSLRSRLERGVLSPADLIRLGAQVAEALGAAHAQGVIHLDVKPDNILLDADGNAAVTDFGIARMMTGGGHAAAGMASGTPHYMSPEQVAGDRLDGRADVYALGAVLYEAATGRTPVAGDSAAKVMANQVGQAPDALRKVAPDLPAAIDRVITRALAKDPAERWQSARAMAEALLEAGTADNLLSPRLARRRSRRRWYRRGCLVGVGAAVLIGAIGYAVFVTVRAFVGGPPPALTAMGIAIPEAVLDSARAAGYVGAADTVEYVFIPNGGAIADGLLITGREFIVPGGGQVRRVPRTPDMRLNFNWRNDRGRMIASYPPTERADTIYIFQSGVEMQAVGTAVRQLLSVPAVDSASPDAR